MNGATCATTLASSKSTAAFQSRVKCRCLFVMIVLGDKFVHIPKTGGTSLEHDCDASKCLFTKYKKKSQNPFAKTWLSPWHFPPDMYREVYHDDFFLNSTSFSLRGTLSCSATSASQ